MTSRSGESSDFEKLYAAHWRLVVAIGMGILGDQQLAEDAAQETWVRVARALDRGESPRRPSAWVAHIARNEAFRFAPRPRPATLVREPVSPELGVSPEDEEGLVRVRGALDRLEEEDRRVLELRYFRGLSLKLLGAELGLSRTGVWKKVNAALKRLRKALDAGGPDREAGG